MNKSKSTVTVLAPLKDQGKEFVDSVLIPGLGSSSWLKELPPTIGTYLFGGKVLTPSHLYSKIKRMLKYGTPEEAQEAAEVLRAPIATAKTCPGIKRLLSNSLVVVCPTDVHITVFKSGDWLANVAEGEFLTITEDHPIYQLDTLKEGSSIFRGRGVIKFKIPIHLSAVGDYLILPAQYHKAHESLQTLVGLVPRERFARKGATLNIINTLNTSPDEDYDITIKKGTPLAYLWSSTPWDIKYSTDYGSDSSASIISCPFSGKFLAPQKNTSNL